jgi:hypothetical protein
MLAPTRYLRGQHGLMKYSCMGEAIVMIATTDNWYYHIPKSVNEHEDITVLWNQGVQMDKEVLANRPYIIVKNKKD